MNHIIETKNLVKKFGPFTAVDGLNLKVKEGEIFGFLGPNGAGKTTTISMLTTLIKTTAGSAQVAGYDVNENPTEVRAVIGVVPQTFSLFPELTPLENLAYIGKLYGMKEQLIKERSVELLKTVSLYEHKDRISGVFSGGMKQRLSLAAGIMSKPKILFMDEPTTGLDPQSRIAIRELTRKLNKEGMTIIYTTHDMEEAEKLCDTICIMDKGRIIAEGTSRQIKDKVRESHVVEMEIENVTKKVLEGLRAMPSVKHVHHEGKIVELSTTQPEGIVYRLSNYLQKHNAIVHEIRIKEKTLEEVFITLTKKELRD